MNRTERHHLKENEIQNLAREAREVIQTRGRETLIGAVVVIVIGAAAAGYYGWHEHVQAKAHQLLAEAMTVQDARIGPPPAPGTPSNGLYFPTERERSQAALTKFKIAADAYPSTDAGVYARYQEGATSLALGTPTGAAEAFQQVIAHDANGFYGQMAKLGLAAAQMGSGQVRQGDRRVQRARATQGWTASGGRNPDAARTSVRGRRQDRRRAADLQSTG